MQLLLHQLILLQEHLLLLLLLLLLLFHLLGDHIISIIETSSHFKNTSATADHQTAT